MNRFAHTGRGDFSGFKKRSNGMFSVGEYIVYGTTGVCRIESVGPMQMSGVSKEKLYYTLAPLYSKGSKVFIPVDNDKVIMRPVLTKEEAQALVEEIPKIELLWVADEKTLLRRYAYAGCLPFQRSGIQDECERNRNH